ncbi:NADPH-dependent FMN reductase [Thermodesulfatator indicus DSM 15286]|uniref:NADPH-dependent FMN reductase n=1 Tax=Thermodesulfatator indicus (strain DSM 15286 / JCM 11887 / CIR29812) TaxID=667014 RepID=F8AB49_THEID|nr:flavodoxin family protein [Thermodesulfatator indicus]AEH45505.1 NADPH-dependent FMN reductase [Thermodesulfatator indicus DSM 15286]
MKILAFQGSPRIGGNTDLLLDSFLKGAEEAGAIIEKIYLYRVEIGPCIECGECDDTGECVISDDMKNIYPKIDAADVIVMASPIFFYNISSRTQALVERSQARWVCKYVLKKEPPFGREKQGIFLSLGATKGKKLFEGAQRVIRYFFDAVYARYEGGLFYRGIEKKGDIKKHPSALKEAYALGKAVGEGTPPETWPLVRDPSP